MIKVLSLSTDRKIFEPDSAVARRMVEYGNVLGDLRIVVLAGKQAELKLSDKVTVYSTNSFSRLFYLTDALNLVFRLNGISRADWLSAQDPFETGLVLWVANLFIKTKLQLQLHTDVFSPFFAESSFLNRLRVVLAKFLLPKASRIRVVSEKIFNSLTNGPLFLPASKITILPVLIDWEELKKQKINVDLRQKYPQFEKIVLMASRFEPEKDLGTALRAFKQVVSKRPKVGMIIVGGGTEKEKIEKMIKSLGLTVNVIMEAWTDNLFSYFKTADIYLLTSLFEGYSRTLVEASLAEIPFISTDVGCAKELITLGIPGLVVPVRNKEVLTLAINSLVAKEPVTKEKQFILPNSIHFMTKDKFLEAYRKSFT